MSPEIPGETKQTLSQGPVLPLSRRSRGQNLLLDSFQLKVGFVHLCFLNQSENALSCFTQKLVMFELDPALVNERKVQARREACVKGVTGFLTLHSVHGEKQTREMRSGKLGSC